MSGHIHHLALGEEWRAALQRGTTYDRSTVGASVAEVGFIHCSFDSQLESTFMRYYLDEPDVVVLTIDPDLAQCELRVEDLHGNGEAFPHLYGPLPLDAVIRAEPWPGGSRG